MTRHNDNTTCIDALIRKMPARLQDNDQRMKRQKGAAKRLLGHRHEILEDERRTLKAWFNSRLRIIFFFFGNIH